MSDITPFHNVDEAKYAHIYRSRLWNALKEWTALVAEWEQSVFNLINIQFISECSEKYQKIVI
jgi:hypothetical protein